MKNIFKKNSIIITALAIMIVIAGYLSFTNRDVAKDKGSDVDSVTTSGSNVTDEDAQASDIAADTTSDVSPDADVADTGTDSSKASDADVAETTDTDANATDDGTITTTKSDELGKTDISDEDNTSADASDTADNGNLNLDDGKPGDAVLASASVDAGYFASTKLEREQTRAKSKDTLLEVINSTTASEKEKQKALDAMIDITQTAAKEAATEMLLGAKGFEDSVVFINDGTVDVVVNAPSLSDQQLAIIEDIVKEKTEIPVKHIEIIPTVIQD